MSDVRPTIYVIDDDPSARRGLSRIIEAAGMRVKAYESALDFLDETHDDNPGCIVLDVKMPDLDGLSLQAELMGDESWWPIIFVSGESEVPDVAMAMKRGAKDFLAKPVDRDHLLSAIKESLEEDRNNRIIRLEQAEVQNRHDKLTQRESEILKFVITGMLNKQIGCELGITEDTVKVHRGRVMKKMGAGSLAELVRLADLINIKPAQFDD
jgi:FixJ family two-component response regulator